MEQKKNNNGHGGARKGAGRPVGSGNKIQFQTILNEIENATGRNYAEQLALNYAAAIQREDWSKVENYDRAFLNKVVADKLEVETTLSEDVVAARAEAFAQALADIAGAHNGTSPNHRTH